jgi:hypothetical protein
MKSCRSIVVGSVLVVATTTASGADIWQKLRKDGAEVYYADLDLRAAFARANPGVLPEAMRKAPSARARAFDWTTVITKHHVLAQGESINCWAYAALGAFEYNWAIRNGGAMPALAVQPILDRVGKNGSGYAGWALKDLLEHGTCSARAYPHTGKPGKLHDKIKTPYRAIAWGLVTGTGGVPRVEQLKRALVDHGPLVANVYYTPAFTAYKGGVFRDDVKVADGTSTNHILMIVGWDDTRGRSGCWKIQNSWGPRWGEKGCMWIEYGSNNIGHSACWVRAQATQYTLPADIHKQVNAQTTPIPTWPNAKTVKAIPPRLSPITSVQALKKQGERVVVQFRVLGGDIHSTQGHVELFSETSWRHERCLIVRILKSELGAFSDTDDRALLKKYLGKAIRVRGSVQMNPLGPAARPIIEVGDPKQITILR